MNERALHALGMMREVCLTAETWYRVLYVALGYTVYTPLRANATVGEGNGLFGPALV